MNLLIKSALVLDPQSKFHNSKVDILIIDGVITSIGSDLNVDSVDVIESTGLCVSPGWLDMRSVFYDPGEEYKEDFESGSAASRGWWIH